MSGLFDQVVNYSPPLLTSGQVNYDGTWNAATNTPTLVSPPDALSKGDYYVVSAAGTQFGISFAVGDWIISNGTAWEKVDLTDAVSSVFGRTGAVVGDSSDYSAVGITNTAIGAANPSTGAFTSLSSSSTTTLNGTTIPASKTLVVTTDKLSALAATTSAELAGVISDETGSGSLVFANSPTLVSPALGTPSALVGTNITGTAAAFNINGTVGATTPSTVAATSVTALSDSGYQAVVGQLTSGDRVGISGQASGSGTALVFFDNAQTTFRPAIFDASSHSLKISGVEKASVTSTGLQGAIGATAASTGAFTTVTASSTIAATGTVTGSNLSGTNTGDQTTISGNAGTATALQTTRTIGGSNFDGTANVTSFPSPGAIGGTTPAAGSFTTVGASGSVTLSGGTANGVAFLDGSKVLTTGSALTFDGTNLGVGTASYGGSKLVIQNGSIFVRTDGDILKVNDVADTTYFFRLARSGSDFEIVNRQAAAIKFLTNDAERMRIDSSGNVGIGTTGPVSILHLKKDGSGNGVSTTFEVNNGANTNWRIGCQNNVDNGFEITPSTAVGGLTFSTPVATFTSTGLAVTGALSSTTGANFATSSGSVGIGTASPAVRLQVDGGSGAIVSDSSVTASQVVIGVGTLTSGRPFIGTNTNTNALEIGTRDAQPLIFVTNSSFRALIDSTGNVGIGTADQFGGGVKVVGLANATTVPASNPTGGGVLYVESGALKYRGSGGTVTTIANA